MANDVSYDHINYTKTIDHDETLTMLSDALANLLLIMRGNREEIERIVIPEAFENALGHYEAERHGDSEGYHVFIRTVDGDLVDLKKDPS